MRVLVADDNPVFLRLLSSFVQKCGYVPVSSAEGQQAYDLLQQPDAPRLAILDWEMPGKSGLEICRDIRDQQRELPIYIILLTARTDPREVVVGLEAGACDYVRKPMHHEEMRLRLGTWARIIAMEEERVFAVKSQSAPHEAIRDMQALQPVFHQFLDDLKAALLHLPPSNFPDALHLISRGGILESAFQDVLKKFESPRL